MTSTTSTIESTVTTTSSSTTTTLAGLVPGGPPSKTASDCYLELRVMGVENDSIGVEDNRKVLCTDGDACDQGPCGDDICTLLVAPCINQTDPNLADCAPPASLEKALVKGKVSISVPQLLSGPRCASFVQVPVPAKFSKKGTYRAKKSQVRLKGKAVAPKGTTPRKDGDKWILQCSPRLTACPGSAGGAFVR